MTQDALPLMATNPQERAETELAKLRRDCPQSWEAIVERVATQRRSRPAPVAVDEEPAISFIPGGLW